MYLHGLTDKKLKSIYVNSEQSIKPNRDTTMEQARIDFAFQRKPRISKYVFVLDAYKICCLNGLNTNNLGVEHISIPEEGDLVVTNPERTLIDITVRPIYAGGCGEVAQAYERAKNRIVVDRMITILKKINYVYPYHQAIGFYMQLAGFDERSFIKLKKMGMKYDFYLDHDMKAKKYSPEWRMYYPAKL